jgi:lysozyme
MTRRINVAGVTIVRRWEGLHDGDPTTPALEPLLCPARVWTVGWGHALTVGGRQLRGEGDRHLAHAEWRRRWPSGLTRAEAEALLDADLARFEAGVARLCPVPMSDNQYSALVSLTYNIGLGAEGGEPDFADSTLRRKLLAGDVQGAADQFPLWRMAGGKVLPGLVNRRREERALFLTPDSQTAPLVPLRDLDAPPAPRGPAPVLERGARGDEVRRLQVQLTLAGLYLGPAGADGVFGPATASAVRRFQTSAGLAPTGRADAVTLAALDRALAPAA